MREIFFRFNLICYIFEKILKIKNITRNVVLIKIRYKLKIAKEVASQQGRRSHSNVTTRDIEGLKKHEIWVT